MITIETVVQALLTQRYKDKVGSNAFRILRRENGQEIKVYYNNYTL